MLRFASFFMIALVSFFKGHVIAFPSLFHNLSIFNADNPICKTGYVVVVGNHHDSLPELRTGTLDKSQHLGWSCCQRLPVGSSASTIAGLVIRARAIATRCCCPPEDCSAYFSVYLPAPTSERSRPKTS